MNTERADRFGADWVDLLQQQEQKQVKPTLADRLSQILNYNPDQERDEKGQFSGGGAALAISKKNAISRLEKVSHGRKKVPIKELSSLKSEQTEVDADRVKKFIQSYPAWKDSKGLGYRVGRKLHIVEGNHRSVAADLLKVDRPEIVIEEDTSDYYS